MKRYTIIILAAVLSMLGIQTASAQQTQDALYIYRNDGGFNAFFFGDINRIEYSKIDTLGVEQDDYVVQEVWALDTVYRIPLNAIDSVAFVTPETKYKADVFRPDKSIADYIVASDSSTWFRLASNTPETLIPKKGSKILIYEESKYIPYGFCGLVTSVSVDADGYMVSTDDVEITDIFEQVVIKTAGAPNSNQTRIRAASDEVGIDSKIPLTFPHIKKEFGMKKKQSVFSEIFDNFDVVAEAGQSISLDVQPTLYVRAFLLINPLVGVSYDSFVKMDLDTKISVNLSGKLSSRLDIPAFDLVPNEALKAADYLFGYINTSDKLFKLKINLAGGIFVEGSGEVVLKGSFGAKFHTATYQTYQNWWKHDGVWNAKEKASVTDEKSSYEMGYGDFTISKGVYAKLDCHISLYNRFKDENYKYGATLSSNVAKSTVINNPVLPDDIPEDLFDTSDGALFKGLDKEDRVSQHYYVEIQAKGYWNKKEKEEEIIKKQFFNNSYRAVPIFTNFDYSQNIDNSYNIKIDASGTCLFPTPIGFATFLVDEENNGTLVDDWWTKEDYMSYYPEERWREITRYNLHLDPLKGQKATYKVYPQIQIKYLGSLYKKAILANQRIPIVLDPAFLQFEKDTLWVDNKEGTDWANYKTNIPTIEASTNGDWVKVEYNKDCITINYQALPEGTTGRKCDVFVIGKAQKGGEILRDTIVIQQGEEVGNARVEPTMIEIPAEGAVRTAKYYFGDYKSLGRQMSDAAKEWINASWSNNDNYKDEVVICVGPNTTNKARQDTIKMGFTMVKGSPFDERYIIPIVVKQAAGPYNLADAKSYLVGSWRYKETVSGSYDIDKDYLITFNSNGTYKEVRKEDAINYDYHTSGTEEGTYEVTEIMLDPRLTNCITVYVTMTYNNGESTRKTSFDVLAHRIFYWKPRLHYYDKVE